MSVPTVTLQSDETMPVVGFGTGGLDGDPLIDAIHTAIETGYTRFDTAEGYGNESAVGDAVAEYDRDDLFLTSKVLPSNLAYESVIEACNASLERLGTDYLDLYLIHWPNPAISLRETLSAMATLHEEGLIRSVGVSNCSAYQLSCAQHVSDVPIAVNQIEFHPWRRQSAVVDYCQKTDVVVDAAAPLARTEVFEESTVQALAETYDRTPAQIVLRWALENDVTVIPHSTAPEHVRENLALFDWDLSEEDRRRLDELDRDHSVYNLSPTDWTDDTFGISR
ncbi:aldo/keto reductase [Halobacteria archaeon AArc-m2/3/4]|uniref:Aldo/keto reductase n=1 Tax=Natronoglomus mannanivorans TaxID=2979990 RepID=A0AAP3E032_9EURY|nr:aldo/keto reductase [Halobacteria archaeon AArc-xg1-1]MCU4971825.1 aldo/keto reductase [Halobacteria archaeon AArc-m2/3/4]